MSGRKFCRICLTEVISSAEMFSIWVDIRQMLRNILPGMNTSLTNSLLFCEKCTGDLNFANRVKENFIKKKKEFVKSNYGRSCIRSYCCLCFRFETTETLFLHNSNYSTENLKGVIEIALSELKILDTEINICGVCWTSIKKIYSFKKQCFKMEENLKHFCNRYNLKAISDQHLEMLLFEQHSVKTGKMPSSNLETITMFQETVYNSDEAVYKEYFQDTGQMFSDTRPKEVHTGDNIEYDTHEETLTSPKFEETCNTIRNNNVNDCETPIDADDEFNETLERKTGTSDKFVIILSDDEGNECSASPKVSTKELMCTNNLTRRTSPDSRITDNNIESDNIITNNAEDILSVHFIINNKNKLNQAISNKPNNKNKYEKTSQGIDSCNRKQIKKPDKCKNVKSKNIYGDTPQFTKINKKYTNPRRDRKYQIVEDNTSSFIHSLESREINNLADQGKIVSKDSSSINLENNNTNVIKNLYKNRVSLSRTSDLSQDNFSDMQDKTFYLSKKDQDAIKNNFGKTAEENVVNDNILLPDEDCFEVVTERNNTVSLSNIDSDVKETQVVDQGHKYADELWGCHICIAKFIDKETVRKHMLSHNDPCNQFGRFMCNKCPFRASWKGSLTRHEVLHNKEYFCKTLSYMCPYCSNIFNTKGDMKTHINEHVISWKNFQCGDCMFTTNRSDTLRQHYLKHHRKARDPTF